MRSGCGWCVLGMLAAMGVCATASAQQRSLPIGHRSPHVDETPATDAESMNLDGYWQTMPTMHPPRGEQVVGTVLDAERDQILFLCTHGALYSVSRTSGLWERLPVRGPIPNLIGCAVAFDSTTDSILLVEGQLSAPGLAVWRLDMQRGLQWMRIHGPGNGAPSSRTRMLAAAAPDSRALVVFGGFDGVGHLDETWVFELEGEPHWRRLNLTGVTPGSQSNARLVYDTIDHRAILLTDRSLVSPVNAWALTWSPEPRWQALDPTGGPHFLEDRVVGFDSDHHMIWLDGGAEFPPPPVYALALDGTARWTEQGEVLSRTGHGGVYEPRQNGFLVALGTGDYFQELYYDYPAGQIEIRRPGEPYGAFVGGEPSWLEPRHMGSPIAWFDVATGEVRTTGGFWWKNSFYWDGRRDYPYRTPVPRRGSAAWQASPSSRWVPFAVEGDVPELAGMAWALDLRRNRIVAFGGTTECSNLSCDLRQESWELDLSGTPPKWRRLATAGTTPPGRVEAIAAIDPQRDRLLVVGGHRMHLYWSGQIVDRELWSLDLGTNTWSRVPTSSTPMFQERLSGVLQPEHDRWLIYSPEQSGTLWSLSLASGAWELLRQGAAVGSAPIAPDALDPVIFDPVGQRLLVQGRYGDIGALSLVPPFEWRMLDVGGWPAAPGLFRGWVHDSTRDRFWLVGGSPPQPWSVFVPRRPAGPARPVSVAAARHGGEDIAPPTTLVARAVSDRRAVRLELRGVFGTAPVRFEVFDLQGRRAVESEVHPTSEIVTISELDASRLTPGVYLARATTRSGSWMRRFLWLR